MGADLAGLARPLLQVAMAGEEVLIERLEGLGRQLQIACFYAGVGRVVELDRSVIRRRQEPGNPGPTTA